MERLAGPRMPVLPLHSYFKGLGKAGDLRGGFLALAVVFLFLFFFS